nr:hypothetical protein CFP56_15479 [Quercus suber]
MWIILMAEAVGMAMAMDLVPLTRLQAAMQNMSRTSGRRGESSSSLLHSHLLHGSDSPSSSSSSMPSLSSGTKLKPISLHDPLMKLTPSRHKLDPTPSSFAKSIMVHMVFNIVDLRGDDDNIDEVLVDVLGGGMVD